MKKEKGKNGGARLGSPLGGFMVVQGRQDLLWVVADDDFPVHLEDGDAYLTCLEDQVSGGLGVGGYVLDPVGYFQLV